MVKKIILSIFILTFISTTTFAQFSLENLKKKVQKKVENRVEKNIDKGIDKSLDKVEEEAGKSISGTDSSQVEQNANPNATAQKIEEKTNIIADSTQKSSPKILWNKYDFIPGTEIIFEDNLENEQNGEFPSKWDLYEGNIEIVNFEGENVIYFIKANANGGGGIVPLIKNSNEDYLPNEFTVEFDAYFPSNHLKYYVFLTDFLNQRELTKNFSKQENPINQYLRFEINSADGKDISKNELPSEFSVQKGEKWRHIAISFNNRALKAYLDQTRILNIPNIQYNPTGIGISTHNPSGKIKGYIKNIRIAKGAVPLYDKFLTDGKFVTTGIKFDIGKASIKPESIGIINYVYEMMKNHSELKFSVEGHTDSDGNDSFNQKLSEERANSVISELVGMGIESNRLTGKGWGESKPIYQNTTPEEKHKIDELNL